MSSILIKGMKMPKNCKTCGFVVCDDEYSPEYWCPIVRDGVENYVHCRHKLCPLVEIPPHGRLIDADRLEYNGLRCYTPEVYEPPRDDTELVISKYEIDEETPTVIEEEGVSDNECSY